MISRREWLQRTMGAGGLLADNMGDAVGRLPDAAMRKRMIQLMEELP